MQKAQIQKNSVVLLNKSIRKITKDLTLRFLASYFERHSKKKRVKTRTRTDGRLSVTMVASPKDDDTYVCSGARVRVEAQTEEQTRVESLVQGGY